MGRQLICSMIISFVGINIHYHDDDVLIVKILEEKEWVIAF